MIQLALLAFDLFGQAVQVERPTMQFTNLTRGSISVYVHCKDNDTFENNKRPLVIRGGATASIPLREGNFEVIARNEYGVEDRNSRTLAAHELDWMDFRSLNAGKTVPKFEIVEHPKKN